MTILKLTQNANGTHDDQTAEFDTIPWGFAELPQALLPFYEQYKPFVNLSVSHGAIVGLSDNAEARLAWTQAIAQEQTKAERKAQIKALKEQLESTDYKVIKCYEYSLIGDPLPYDIQSLHSERQAIRDQINALEAT